MTDILGIILATLIVVNIVIALTMHNWPAFGGWFVAGLECSRRWLC